MADIDNKTQEKAAENKQKRLDLDRYLRLAYDQDYAPLLDPEKGEEEFRVDEYKKLTHEFADKELDIISCTLNRLIAYDPASRGGPMP